MDVFENLIQEEMEKWNEPDEVAYRNRHGCEFEKDEPTPYSFWDLKESMEEM